MSRRVLQLLPAPVAPDGAPVLRLATYDGDSTVVQPVVALALVRYGKGDAAHDVVEAVAVDDVHGTMFIGNTQEPPEEGWPVDRVLALGTVAVDVRWYETADKRHQHGSIQTKTEPGGIWASSSVDAELPPRPLGATRKGPSK